MRREIVAGVDASPAAGAALAWAAEAAQRRQCALRVIHAYQRAWVDLPIPVPPDEGEALRAAETLVAEAVSEARMLAPGIEVTGAALLGDPATLLIEQSQDATLLVTGSRGRDGFAGLLLGSVALRVASHAPVPVVIVRADAYQADGPVVAGVDTERDQAAVELAVAEAAASGCGLTVIRAWDPPALRYPGLPDDYAAEMETAERHWLTQLVSQALARHPQVRVDIQLYSGGPARALVEASRHARLVVAGTRGYGGLRALLVGATGLQLLHHAHCPVLIARPSAS
ncbi:universal stress protein [Longispora albida]|uniref:universal stress protein n=1 Tax=Longispora albida TaxID=203523 RepID=UPI0003711B1F|nr:universal stress protein [Longispora albida]